MNKYPYVAFIFNSRYGQCAVCGLHQSNKQADIAIDETRVYCIFFHSACIPDNLKPKLIELYKERHG